MHALRHAAFIVFFSFVFFDVGGFAAVRTADAAGRNDVQTVGYIHGKLDGGMSRRKGESVVIKELELKQCRVQDALRVISEMTGLNIVATNRAGEAFVTLYINNMTAPDAVESICRICGLWYRYTPKAGMVVMTTAEYQRDIVVFRNEPTRMFQLKYLNVGIAARTIADLFGDRVQLYGRANSYLGDDYMVGEMVEFTEAEDDYGGTGSYGTGSRRSTSTSSRQGTSTGWGQKSSTTGTSQRYGTASRRSGTASARRRTSTNSRQSAKQKASGESTDRYAGQTELTPSQLARLEEMGETQMVSEGVMRQVSQRNEPPIYVSVNRMHNMLFVRTSDEDAIRDIAKIIRDSDQRVPEVLLEMKVLEIKLDDQFQSAFDFTDLRGSSQEGPDDGRDINPLNSDATTVRSSLLGLGSPDLLSSSTFVYQYLNGNLRMRIQLLAQDNKVKSLATPMLLAANNHPARLFIGEETVLTTGFESQEVEVSSGTNVVVNTIPVPVTENRDVGSSLIILPSINADRTVVMRIVYENSSVNTDGGKIPLVVDDAVQNVSVDTVSTSTLEGTVLAHDGMTIAVGGMIRTSHVDNDSKVPFLGDIPLLGFFFKKIDKQAVKTELVLLITPHILSAPSQGEEVTRERLGELMHHPNEVDTYLDSLGKSRAAKQKGNAGLSDGSHRFNPAASPNGGEMQKAYIEMTRVAVKQVRIPAWLRKPEGNVRPVELQSSGEVPIFSYSGILSRPVGVWTDGIHFVTALKIMNRTGQSRQLDVVHLIGNWQAATLEREELSPAEREGDSTYLYLVSDTNFETAISGKVQP